VDMFTPYPADMPYRFRVPVVRRCDIDMQSGELRFSYVDPVDWMSS